MTWLRCPLANAKLFAGVTAPAVFLLTLAGSRTSVDQLAFEPGSVLAAAAITRRPAAGDPSVPSLGPELPAAATTLHPSRVALSEAMAVGSSGPPPPPRLMLMTLAIGFGWKSTVCGDTASSIPIMMTDEKHPPSGQPIPVAPWMTAPPSAAVESESLHTL